MVVKINQKKTTIQLNHPSLKVPQTMGQRVADKVTKWAGSWTFILSFTGFLILWMIVNTFWIIFRRTWDPYPFILLNLILSCLAAFQAPIILMSQNRENERDRQKLEYDYAVNRKAEREVQEIKKIIKSIHRKISKSKDF